MTTCVPRSCAASLALAWLAGCGTALAPPARTPDPPALAGTQWQLVAIQSMADDQPTARPDEPSRYTLRFGTDGQAVLRLDCNRGTAGWQAEPASAQTPGRRSGTLTFGGLASTRAMCPPGSLAPRLASALPFVRSYLLTDGQLHLSLLADGGILSWAPAP